MAIDFKKLKKPKAGTKSASPVKEQNTAAKEYDDTNRGVLFVNDKDGNEARPDYRGEINVGGEKYRLSAWLNESPKVGQYIKIAVSPFEQS